MIITQKSLYFNDFKKERMVFYKIISLDFHMLKAYTRISGLGSHKIQRRYIMSEKYPLNVPTPTHFTYVVKDLPKVTVEEREKALKATHYNEFAFPSGL